MTYEQKEIDFLDEVLNSPEIIVEDGIPPEAIALLEDLYTKPVYGLTGTMIMQRYGYLWRKGFVQRPPLGSEETASLVLTSKGYDAMFDNRS
jgi:hypothetical protein